MHHLPNLIWLRAFEVTARAGSFTAAAAELHLTQAAVSHQIRSLEATLGFPLFVRRPRVLELTDMGRAYLPSVRKAIEDLALSTEGLFGLKTKNTVTVRAPISTAVCWLGPLIAEFQNQNEAINIRLLSSIWADSIQDEDVDIDIRLGKGAWAGHHSDLLSRETVTAVCAIAALPHLKQLSDLARYPMIHIMGFQNHWAKLFREKEIAYDSAYIKYELDTTAAAAELVSAGVGVAMIMTRLAVALAHKNRLAIPFSDTLEMEQHHYLVRSAEAPARSEEAQVFETWLREKFAEK
ncbi:MAG: LysR substrate-binding domain-containing protein [Sneathiella sp.]